MSHVQFQQTGSSLHLVLSGGLTIAEAAAVHAALRAGCATLPVDVTVAVLHTDQVSVADTAGVQLLLSLASSLRARGLTLQMAGRSTAIDGVARALGACDVRQCCGFAGETIAAQTTEVLA
jgi:anti-anti-sigma regulatory factor